MSPARLGNVQNDSIRECPGTQRRGVDDIAGQSMSTGRQVEIRNVDAEAGIQHGLRGGEQEMATTDHAVV